MLRDSTKYRKTRSMKARDLTRRSFVKQSTLAAGATLPLASAPAEPGAAPLKIVCVGGHPDDPESGCGGTLARYSALGHAVTIIYLTRGERGISGTSLDEAARIRSAESEAACRILGAKPMFFGQIDGATEMTRSHVDAMSTLLAAEHPDVVFTHWPVDTHMDHQVASMLTIRAWMNLRTPRLYFYEVNSGSQTEGFLPNTYVDIASLLERKKAALFAHVSQDGQGIWREHHEVMAQWRGREAGVAAAEAFVHLNRDPTGNLPGL
jgi:LmbE family N-acetylglucosaminyl deacetylase